MKLQVLAMGSRPWQAAVKYWGLSFLINDTLLFDTFANFKTLSGKLEDAAVDVTQIAKVVISHDHWDHTGGLEGFAQWRGAGIDIYLPSPASAALKSQAGAHGARVIDGVTEPIEIAPDVILLPAMDGYHKKELVREQALLVKTPHGQVLIVGCAHPGIVAMVRAAKKLLGQPIVGVIGGLHLMDKSEEQIEDCIRDLKEEGVVLSGATHCTGAKAEKMFAAAFGSGYCEVKEGKAIMLPAVSALSLV